MKQTNHSKVCKQCKAKCCKIGGADATQEEVDKIVRAGYANFFRKIGENHYEMVSKELRCSYLGEDNLCSIYKLRPNACKAFPVNSVIENDRREDYLAACSLGRILSKKDSANLVKYCNLIPDKLIRNKFNNTLRTKEEIKKILITLKGFGRLELRQNSN